MNRLCAGLTMAIGLATIAGWAFQIDSLARWIPGTVAMQPMAAICFSFAGLSVLLATKRTAAAMFAAACILTMGSAVITIVTAKVGATAPFPPNAMVPGVPAQAAILAFWLLTVPMFLRLVDGDGTDLWLRLSAVVVSAMGMVGVLGYATRDAAMYFYWPGVTVGMAFNTAIAFVLLGIAVYSVPETLRCQDRRKESSCNL